MICQNASVLAFHLWPAIFAGAPFWLQNICRNGVPPRSSTTTPKHFTSSHCAQSISGIKNVTVMINCAYYMFSNTHSHFTRGYSITVSGQTNTSVTDISHQSIAVLDSRLTGGEVRPGMSDVALQQQQMLDKVGQCL